VFSRGSALRSNVRLLLLLMGLSAGAAADTPVEEANRLLGALEAAQAAQNPNVARPMAEAKKALESATARTKDATSKHRELLQATALGWAQLARDTQRALVAEQAAERAESELSRVQTELVRAHAAVEQGMARLGRAREELKTLQQSAPAPAGVSSEAPAPVTAPREPKVAD
jgi:hypothetical protein